MADRDEVPPHLGELEQAVMDVLWQHQQATIREVASQLTRTPPLAYTTVATVMSRLVEKGLLVRARSGKVDLYRPAYDSAEFSRRVARAAVHQLVHEYGDVALAQFAAALERADPERVAQLRARYQLRQSQESRQPEQAEDPDADT